MPRSRQKERPKENNLQEFNFWVDLICKICLTSHRKLLLTIFYESYNSHSRRCLRCKLQFLLLPVPACPSAAPNA